jgi:hypothetical protein
MSHYMLHHIKISCYDITVGTSPSSCTIASVDGKYQMLLLCHCPPTEEQDIKERNNDSYCCPGFLLPLTLPAFIEL